MPGSEPKSRAKRKLLPAFWLVYARIFRTFTCDTEFGMTASHLRNDLCKILDGVLSTGEPVEIVRKGRILRIIAEPEGSSKVAGITKRPGLINGDPFDLAELDWAKEWNPDSRI